MDTRAHIAAALDEASGQQEPERLCMLRLMHAAIRDRDQAAAKDDDSRSGISEAEVRATLARMARQRQESAQSYEETGRLDLAERERAEIAVIESFLPGQLSDEEIEAAISGAIDETRADSIRDLGRVMGTLKGRYAGQMDFCRVSPRVRQRLG